MLLRKIICSFFFLHILIFICFVRLYLPCLLSSVLTLRILLLTLSTWTHIKMYNDKVIFFFLIFRSQQNSNSFAFRSRTNRAFADNEFWNFIAATPSHSFHVLRRLWSRICLWSLSSDNEIIKQSFKLIFSRFSATSIINIDFSRGYRWTCWKF